MTTPQSDDIDGLKTNAAVLVQLPDGRVVVQYGHAEVDLRSEREETGWRVEHSTRLDWPRGYTLQIWDNPMPTSPLEIE